MRVDTTLLSSRSPGLLSVKSPEAGRKMKRNISKPSSHYWLEMILWFDGENILNTLKTELDLYLSGA